MSTQIILSPSPFAHGNIDRPPTLFLPHAKAAERFFEFFAANINNDHNRRAYSAAKVRNLQRRTWNGNRRHRRSNQLPREKCGPPKRSKAIA
jgi:hypothetical protein